MSGQATGLDHVGVAVPDLGAAAEAWAAIGFTVQPLAAHMNGGMPTGTGNRNIMLREGYVELLATIDPAKPSGTIGRFLAHHEGIHVLTLATEDAEAAGQRLGLAVSRSSRAADPLVPDGPQAAFARIPLADADPRLQLLQHLTPALVWQERFLGHANQAVALREVIVAAEAPAPFAARLSRVAGRAVVPDPLGGYALRLAGGQVRVLAPEVAAGLLPGVAMPGPVCIAGLSLATGDGARAAAALPGAEAVAGGVLLRVTGVGVRFLA